MPMRTLALLAGVLLVALLAACGRAEPTVAPASEPASPAVQEPTPSVALTSAPPPDTTPSPPVWDPKELNVTRANPADTTSEDTVRGFSWPKSYLVQLQAHNGRYVVADSDGRIRANRGSPQEWETFLLVDFNGGALYHDDKVALVAHNGFFSADWPGNEGRTRWTTGFWIFTIKTCCGKAGEVINGDGVHFAAAFPHWWNWNNRWYWGTPFMVAEGGGGGDVNYNREIPREWETFRITNAGGARTQPQLNRVMINYDLKGPFERSGTIIVQAGWFVGDNSIGLTQVTPLTSATP